MHRTCLMLPLLLTGLQASEPSASAALASASAPLAYDGLGHRWPSQTVRSYVYTLDHQVSWRSAGERLMYRQELRWDAQAIGRGGDSELGVGLYITRLQAEHEGPEGVRRFDSARPEAERDSDGVGRALLGDLAVFDGARFELRVASATGGVVLAPGSSDLAAALDARHPAPNPSLAPPLQEAGRSALGPARLGQFFTRLFETPGQTGPFDLGAPISGSVQRHWEGGAWSVQLGAARPQVTLARRPEVVLTMTALRGGGRIDLRNGVLNRSEAELHYTLSGTPFTQAIEQQHELRWSFQLVEAPARP